MAVDIYRNFFIKKMWPEFTKKDFFKIISKFKNINRNYGGLNDKFSKRIITSMIIILTLLISLNSIYLISLLLLLFFYQIVYEFHLLIRKFLII